MTGTTKVYPYGPAREREIKVQFYNGAGYVVRRVTRWTVLVGTRQGLAAPSGLVVRSYVHDAMPAESARAAEIGKLLAVIVSADAPRADECDCMPGEVCEPCRARGYRNGLAGYAARIYPDRVTADDIETDRAAERAREVSA